MGLKFTNATIEQVRMQYGNLIAAYYFYRKDRKNDNKKARYERERLEFSILENYVKTFYGVEKWIEAAKKAARGCGWEMETYWINS